MKQIKLFTIPYAGGSSVVFQEWKKYFDNEIELIPIELAGRGKRFNNPLYNTLEEAVDDVLKQIQSCLVPGDDYALFGHSMGG